MKCCECKETAVVRYYSYSGVKFYCTKCYGKCTNVYLDYEELNGFKDD